MDDFYQNWFKEKPVTLPIKSQHLEYLYPRSEPGNIELHPEDRILNTTMASGNPTLSETMSEFASHYDYNRTLPEVGHGNASFPLLDPEEAFGTNVTDPETTTKFCTNEYCIDDDEYIDMILDYLFPKPFEWCLIAAYAVVFVIGLVGNFLVCFAVWRNRSMRTITNYFIVNLAIADFLVVLICLPPTVLEDIYQTWYMERIGCKVVKYLQVGVTMMIKY